MKIHYENATVADYLELQNKLKQGGKSRLFAQIRITCLAAILGFGNKKG